MDEIILPVLVLVNKSTIRHTCIVVGTSFGPLALPAETLPVGSARTVQLIP